MNPQTEHDNEIGNVRESRVEHTTENQAEAQPQELLSPYDAINNIGYQYEMAEGATNNETIRFQIINAIEVNDKYIANFRLVHQIVNTIFQKKNQYKSHSHTSNKLLDNLNKEFIAVSTIVHSSDVLPSTQLPILDQHNERLQGIVNRLSNANGKFSLDHQFKRIFEIYYGNKKVNYYNVSSSDNVAWFASQANTNMTKNKEITQTYHNEMDTLGYLNYPVPAVNFLKGTDALEEEQSENEENYLSYTYLNQSYNEVKTLYESLNDLDDMAPNLKTQVEALFETKFYREYRNVNEILTNIDFTYNSRWAIKEEFDKRAAIIKTLLRGIRDDLSRNGNLAVPRLLILMQQVNRTLYANHNCANMYYPR